MMIKKMNNCGLTAIEVLVCFSIVVVIVMSMFKVVNNQRDKQTIESYKNSITTYKNSVTKIIEEDVRKYGGIKNVNSIDNQTDYVTITFELKKENQTRKIYIFKKYECDEDSEGNTVTDCSSNNYIKYFDSLNATIPKEKFEIPNIYNLKLNKIEATNEDGYLKIYVGFNHPDLGNKYSAFNFIHPINPEFF